MTAPFLTPSPAGPSPLESTDLLDFIQAWLSGVSGIDGTLVRPNYQTEPPVIPQEATCWMGFTLSAEKSDVFPYVGEGVNGGGDYQYEIQRHETLRCLCSFYDTGSTGLAQKFASITRDGASIPQNNEYLQLQGMTFVACDPEIPVPSLLKQRWLYRVDLPVWLRRQINRTYTVPTIAIGQAELNTDVGITKEIETDG